MGVDWVPARPRADADAVELLRSVDEQASVVGGWLADGDGDGAQVAQVSERLLAALRMPQQLDGGWPSFRVSVIGGNPLFPPAWRREAYRTLLPDQAVAAVARWQDWNHRLRAGEFARYRRHLVVWELAGHLRRWQEALVESVDRAVVRSNAWTRTEQFRTAFARIRELSPVPAVEEPESVPSPDVNTLDDLAVVVATIEEHRRALLRSGRDFNRSVPAAFKRPAPREILADPSPDDLWVDEFFLWARPFLDDGYGLYLWA